MERAQADNLALLLKALEKRKKYNKLETLFPDTGPWRRELYPKHLEFFTATKDYHEVAFVAANRVGKTQAGCSLLAWAATGEYPDWYPGRRFDSHPVKIWCVGKNSNTVRDVLQEALLGPINEPGTGLLPKPKEGILETTSKPGTPRAVQDIFVPHKSGGLSQITFKTFDQEMAAFQGTAIDIVLLDEECDNPGIYSECVTRTMKTQDPGGGLVILTFTPVSSITEIVMKFLPGGRFPIDGIVRDENNAKLSRYVVNCDWNDVPHLTEEEKERLLATYSPREREARSRGIPATGAGMIYPVIWEDIIIPQFQIPPWFEKAYGMDIGTTSPTAAIFGARDPESGIIYIYSEHYMKDPTYMIHIQSIKARGAWIMGAVDAHSLAVSQCNGQSMFEIYTDPDNGGLNLVSAGNAHRGSIDAGNAKVLNAFETGRLKICNNCPNLINELRVLRYGEDGKPRANQQDHAADALKYLVVNADRIMQVSPAQEEMFNRDAKKIIDGYGRNPVTGY